MAAQLSPNISFLINTISYYTDEATAQKLSGLTFLRSVFTQVGHAVPYDAAGIESYNNVSKELRKKKQCTIDDVYYRNEFYELLRVLVNTFESKTTLEQTVESFTEHIESAPDGNKGCRVKYAFGNAFESGIQRIYDNALVLYMMIVRLFENAFPGLSIVHGKDMFFLTVSNDSSEESKCFIHAIEQLSDEKTNADIHHIKKISEEMLKSMMELDIPEEESPTARCQHMINFLRIPLLNMFMFTNDAKSRAVFNDVLKQLAEMGLVVTVNDRLPGKENVLMEIRVTSTVEEDDEDDKDTREAINHTYIISKKGLMIL
jgi:hypothetical protein